MHLTGIAGTAVPIAGGQFQQQGIAHSAPQAKGGTTFLHLSPFWSGPTTGRGPLVCETGADGALTEIEAVQLDGLSAVRDHPQQLRAGGESVILHHKHGIGNVAAISLRIGGDGRLTPVEDVRITTSRGQFDTAEYGRKGFRIVEGTLAGVGGGTAQKPIANLQVPEMRANGRFRTVFDVPGDDPALDSKMTGGVRAARVGTKTFVFVGENSGGSIAVCRMRADGSLDLVEIESPVTGDGRRFSNGPTLLRGDARTVLAAACNALAIFEVNRLGALTELEDAPVPNGESGASTSRRPASAAGRISGPPRRPVRASMPSASPPTTC